MWCENAGNPVRFPHHIEISQHPYYLLQVSMLNYRHPRNSSKCSAIARIESHECEHPCVAIQVRQKGATPFWCNGIWAIQNSLNHTAQTWHVICTGMQRDYCVNHIQHPTPHKCEPRLNVELGLFLFTYDHLSKSAFLFTSAGHFKKMESRKWKWK